jgi:hypothetical protein
MGRPTFFATTLILVFALTSFRATSLFAQDFGWRLIHSDVVLTVFEGDLRGPSYSDFVADSRNPVLFHPSDSVAFYNHTPRHSTGGIQFRFRFQHSAKPNTEVWAGFGRSESITSLYVLNLNPDSLRILSQSQFFNVSGGYNRLYRPDKRFSFRLGGHIFLGFPTGSRIRHDSDRFFATSGSQFALGATLAMRVRLTRNSFLILDQQPSLWRMTIDGSRFRGTSRGTNLGIEWRL